LHFEFTVNEIAEDILLLTTEWNDNINSARCVEMKREKKSTQERERERERDGISARQRKRKHSNELTYQRAD